VRDSASGRLAAQSRERAGHGPGGVAALAATAPGRFVAAPPAGPGCATQLYRIRLDGHGHLGVRSPVGPRFRGEMWSLAAGGGGRYIGYALSGCGKGSRGFLGVLDTRTGRTRQWSGVDLGGVSSGDVALTGSLSMPPSGLRLAFAALDATGSGRIARQVVRILPTSAPAGTVRQRSHVVLSLPVTAGHLATVSLSAGGAAFYTCTQARARAGLVTHVAAYRTATGKRQRVLATFKGSPPASACTMALDTAGRFLLVPFAITPGDRQVLKAARINVVTGAITALGVRLPASGGMNPATGLNAAW
jgi:hypothetical protein